MSSLPSDDAIKEQIMKLLLKAGTDPRVTPRILREKAEQRLKLDKDRLKVKRDIIKDWILLWWTERNAKFAEDLKLLVKLSKAAGYAPAIFSDIRDMEDREKQKEILSQRLKDKGVVFSDPPTEKEIEDAKKANDLKKEVKDMDTSLIIEGSRRRDSENAGNNSSGHADKKLKTDSLNNTSSNNNNNNSSSSNMVKSPKEKLKSKEEKNNKHNLDADEEADF